ncbi:MAG: glutamate--tRNA ligase [Acidiferrobacterales bacterium]|nr:glutamate--tRNA ligase [Acidiferrobacterales bacterium]
MTVVTRFAPSPTGNLHIGSVRTALFSWLYSRRHNGKFLLRIEDTDRQRSTPEFSELIVNSLDWLGLSHDGDLVYQSDRTAIYQQRARELIEAGQAYHCVCSRARLDALRSEQMKQGLKPRYDNKCRDLDLAPDESTDSVIRFRNPLDGAVVVHDMVQGDVTYDNAQLDDLIIIRPDQTPTYNFSVVVDEIDMGITHVIRGDDHLNNTPRQINLFAAFGQNPPNFGHVPMILSTEGKKMSKRDNVAGVLEYRDMGYLPEAVLNYLVRLGWSHGDQEMFSLDEMIGLFDVRKIHRSPASLDPKKFIWINHQHMMNLDTREICERSRNFFDDLGIVIESSPVSIEQVFEVQKTRSKTLCEFVENSRYFFVDEIEYDDAAVQKHLTGTVRGPLQEFRSALAEISRWTRDDIHGAFAQVVEANGIKFGELAQPVRVALTGGTTSPGIDVTVELIGKCRALERLDRALELVG